VAMVSVGSPPSLEQWLAYCAHNGAPTDGCGWARADHFSEASTFSGDSGPPSTGTHTPMLSTAPLASETMDDAPFTARRMPLGFRNRERSIGGCGADRSNFALAERAAAFCRRGVAENRKLVEAARQVAEFEASADLERRRSAEATQAVRSKAVQHVQEDSLARRAALAMRGAEYKERHLKGVAQVGVNEERAQHQRCTAASERALAREKYKVPIAHAKQLASSARFVESAERRRAFDERCALLDAVADREQAQVEMAMRLLGKVC